MNLAILRQPPTAHVECLYIVINCTQLTFFQKNMYYSLFLLREMVNVKQSVSSPSQTADVRLNIEKTSAPLVGISSFCIARFDQLLIKLCHSIGASSKVVIFCGRQRCIV